MALSNRSRDQPSTPPRARAEVEEAKRRPGVDALEVVLGPEQPPGLRLALAAGDGAQGVEPSGDGADEAPLAADVGGDGAKERRARLVGAVGAPEALDGLVGAPAGLEEVVDAPGGVPAPRVRVVAPPGPACHGEDEHPLLPGHEGGGLGQARRRGAAPHGEAPAARAGELDHPAGAPGHLGDGLVAEVVHELVERGRDGRQRRELLDERVAGGKRLLRQDGVAVSVPHRAAHEIAALVGEGLQALHREGVGEVVEDVLARGQVHAQVVPLGGGELGQAPLEQRLPGRDELDDAGAARLQVRLHRPEERGALHGDQQMAEEALLGALEGRERGGLRVAVERLPPVGHPRRLEGGLEVGVDHLERARVGVVDPALLRGQRVLEDVHLDAVVGEGSCLVEPEGLQVAGDDLHRGDPARLHRRDERLAGLEGGLVRGPEAEPPRVGEPGQGGGPGGGDVEHPRVGERGLELEPRPALLRGGDPPAIAHAPGGVGHRVGLVEDDDAGEGMAVRLLEPPASQATICSKRERRPCRAGLRRVA